MKLISRFIREESGADTVEYALVLGLVSLAAMVSMAAVGSNLGNWWNALGTYINSDTTGEVMVSQASRGHSTLKLPFRLS
jgi:Flp pilus assembly pilin Flp